MNISTVCTHQSAKITASTVIKKVTIPSTSCAFHDVFGTAVTEPHKLFLNTRDYQDPIGRLKFKLLEEIYTGTVIQEMDLLEETTASEESNELHTQGIAYMTDDHSLSLPIRPRSLYRRQLRKTSYRRKSEPQVNTTRAQHSYYNYFSPGTSYPIQRTVSRCGKKHTLIHTMKVTKTLATRMSSDLIHSRRRFSSRKFTSHIVKDSSPTTSACSESLVIWPYMSFNDVSPIKLSSSIADDTVHNNTPCSISVHSPCSTRNNYYTTTQVPSPLQIPRRTVSPRISLNFSSPQACDITQIDPLKGDVMPRTSTDLLTPQQQQQDIADLRFLKILRNFSPVTSTPLSVNKSSLLARQSMFVPPLGIISMDSPLFHKYAAACFSPHQQTTPTMEPCSPYVHASAGTSSFFSSPYHGGTGNRKCDNQFLSPAMRYRRNSTCVAFCNTSRTFSQTSNNSSICAFSLNRSLGSSYEPTSTSAIIDIHSSPRNTACTISYQSIGNRRKKRLGIALKHTSWSRRYKRHRRRLRHWKSRSMITQALLRISSESSSPKNLIFKPYEAVDDDDSSSLTVAAAEGASGLIPTKHIGLSDFEKLNLIGQGGYAKVYAVRDRTTHRMYAAKILEKQSLRDEMDAMRMEVKAMRKLHHPNIVRLHMTTEDSRYLYLLMDICKGDDIDTLLNNTIKYVESNDHLSSSLAHLLCERTVAQIIHHVLAALKYAHSQNFVHRDIKPDNIIVDPETQITKLIDFGISAVVSSDNCTRYENKDATTTLGFMPKPLTTAPPFCPPEGYNSPLIVSPAADMWALGATACAMLACCSVRVSDEGLVDFEHLFETSPEIPASIPTRFTYPGRKRSIINTRSVQALDFIWSLMVPEPEKRLTAAQALEHEWISSLCYSDDIEVSVSSALSPSSSLSPMSLNSLEALCHQVWDQLVGAFDGKSQLRVILLAGIARRIDANLIEKETALCSFLSRKSGNVCTHTLFRYAFRNRLFNSKYMEEQSLHLARIGNVIPFSIFVGIIMDLRTLSGFRCNLVNRSVLAVIREAFDALDGQKDDRLDAFELARAIQYADHDIFTTRGGERERLHRARRMHEQEEKIRSWLAAIPSARSTCYLTFPDYVRLLIGSDIEDDEIHYYFSQI